jgi:cytidylate kinase
VTEAAGIRIAIDGPASSGKGTVARMVAQALDYAYIDSGAMYRTVALLASEAEIDLTDADALEELACSLAFDFQWDGADLHIIVNGRDVSSAIRLEHIGRGASDVAILPQVRSALLGRQRALAAAGSVVMDGRDIGTVVLPEAELKVFLDASVEERATRRYRELQQRSAAIEYDRLIEEIRSRDEQDRGRETAPLKQANDAVYMDTTQLSPAQAASQIVEIARRRA